MNFQSKKNNAMKKHSRRKNPKSDIGLSPHKAYEFDSDHLPEVVSLSDYAEFKSRNPGRMIMVGGKLEYILER